MDANATDLPILGQQGSTPCESCHGGCCRTFAIPITGADIWRIERDLKLSFWEFACRWEDSEGIVAQKYAPHFHFQDEPETPFVITLMQHASTFEPTTTKCRFLLEGEPDAEHPKGISRCGIYDSRPVACRVFPTKFDVTGDLVEILNVPSEMKEEENSIYNLCPRPWEPFDFDPVTTMEHLTSAAHEMQFFHKLAVLWNRNPGPWSIFPDFLKIVYSERVIHGEKVLEEENLPQIFKFPQKESHAPAKRAA